MQYTWLLLLTVLKLLLTVSQDPVAVNPKMVSVVFENDRIRVLRVRSDAHERLEMHSHPAIVVVSITSGSRRVFSAEGSRHDTTVKAGEARWREATTHAVENLSDEPFENIEIEFKQAVQPAVASTSVTPAHAVSPDSQEPVPVQLELHHHIVFENQYARVLDVTLSPGESTLFHTHSHDSVSVRISGGVTQSQVEGQQPRDPSVLESGSVKFVEGAQKPYTHRVKNVGTIAYHVVDVELLQ